MATEQETRDTASPPMPELEPMADVSRDPSCSPAVGRGASSERSATGTPSVEMKSQDGESPRNSPSPEMPVIEKQASLGHSEPTKKPATPKPPTTPSGGQAKFVVTATGLKKAEDVADETRTANQKILDVVPITQVIQVSKPPPKTGAARVKVTTEVGTRNKGSNEKNEKNGSHEDVKEEMSPIEPGETSTRKLKRESCHFDETVVAGFTGNCHFEMSMCTASDENFVKMTTVSIQWKHGYQDPDSI